MGDHAQKKLDELAVFRHFAAVCPLLGNSLNTVEQPHSDPPDIVCELRSGETLAFELVSCEDEIGKDKTGNGIAWTQGINDQLKLKQLLRDEYRSALEGGRVDQPERFQSSTVHVEFESSSMCQRRSAVPRVIELLNQLGPGKHFTPSESPIQLIWCMPWEKKIASCAVPSFSVGSSSFHVGNCTVERIQSKIKDSADYKFNGTMHLLAWSSTACHAESEFWRNDLLNVLQSGTGKFHRIWVFGIVEKSIVFDSQSSA
jgi:hypothetical protein